MKKGEVIKKLIGVVGVDSGKVIICDPAYIDIEWEKEEFEDIRIYQTMYGAVQFGVDFHHYDERLTRFDDKTPNELIRDKEWIEQEPPKSEHNFSYNACCLARQNEATQLNYKAGHPGVAVVSPSGYGDGLYPVFATIEETEFGERVTKLEIIFIDKDKKHPYDEGFLNDKDFPEYKSKHGDH